MAEERYLELFLEEAGEQLEELGQSLIQLERDSRDPEIINGIFRNAHTLKSSAAFVGFDGLSRTAHHMEDLLQLIRSGQLSVTTPLVNLLFKCLDRIRAFVAGVSSGKTPDDDFSDIISELDANKAAAAKSPGPVSTPGPASVPEAPFTSVAESSSGPSLELSMGEQEALKAQAGSSRVYEGYVRVDADAPMKAPRFMLLVQNLKKSGTVFKCAPSEQELDEGKAGSEFHFYFFGDISSAELTKLCQIDMVEETRLSEKQSGGGMRETKSQEDTAVKTRNIKVSSEKIDYLLNSVGELVITNSGLQKVYEDLQDAIKDPGLLSELKSRIDQAGRIARDLQSGIMKTRMIPVGLVFHRFTRPVRDLALELGKDVQFEFQGEETEMDKNIIDGLNEPLLHLVRNALDHGIETPQERQKAGKPAQGRLTMHAYQSGNNIYLEVRDDGRGLNKEKILQKARDAGLVRSEAVLTDDEIYNFVFHPGFSTAEQVTDLSGRGVGMNAVKKMVQEFKGSVSIRNEPGKSLAFVLSFPLTLAIVSAILVQVEDEQYAFPLSDVTETMRLDRREITSLQGREVIHLRGDILPVFPLSRLMGSQHHSTEEELPVIIASVSGRKIAFLVDQMVGKKEIVIKSLEQNFRAVRGLIGACLMGDGSIVMVLDVHGLMELAQKEMSADRSIAALDAIAAMENGAVLATRGYNQKVQAMTTRIRPLRRVRSDEKETRPAAETGVSVEERRPPAPVITPVAPVSVPAAPAAPPLETRVEQSEDDAYEMPALVDIESDPLSTSVPHIEHPDVQATYVEGNEASLRNSVRPEDFPKLNAIVNTGMMQAGLVLSQLLGSQVDVSVPEFQAIDFNRLKEFLPPEPIVGVFISSDTGFRSILLLVFDEETGYRAGADLMGLPQSDTERVSRDDLQSVLSELTNIVGASILNEIANKTGAAIPPTVPGYVHGTVKELIAMLTARDPAVAGRKLLYFSTDFYREGMQLFGRIFFMPDEASLSEIIRKL
jgi:two-component system chemotaxis sensor kinase CheA